jgi:hypothetical protein
MEAGCNWVHSSICKKLYAKDGLLGKIASWTQGRVRVANFSLRHEGGGRDDPRHRTGGENQELAIQPQTTNRKSNHRSRNLDRGTGRLNLQASRQAKTYTWAVCCLAGRERRVVGTGLINPVWWAPGFCSSRSMSKGEETA